LASSYDRSDGNNDFCEYESPPGLQYGSVVATVKTISGPGIIRRFWMPHLTANRSFLVRLFFDGETTPRIDTTSDQFFAGGFAYFTAPLMTTCAGGQFTYEPISFSQSLRIETINKAIPENDWSPDRYYYHYTYSTYPSGTVLSS